MEKVLEPKLRFPEFNKECSYSKLNEMIDFKGGYAFSSKEMSNSLEKYQLIKMSNVYMNQLRLDRNPSYWKEVSKKEEPYVLEIGDVVLTLTGTVGKRDYGYSTSIKKENKYLLNQRLVRLRGKKNKTSSNFIKYLVLNERFLYNFFSNAKGGTGNQSNASVEDIKEIKLYFPPLPEQEKIASFLSSVDSKIEKLEKKKELLEKYKKGTMQKIFSQEIRFKDESGKDYPQWEEKRLGEICKITTGSSNREDSGLDGEYTFFDRSQDIRRSSIYLFDSEAVIVAGEGQEFIPKYYVGKFDLHQRTYAIMDFNSCIGQFIFHYIYKNRSYFLSQAVGSTVKSLRLPMFQKMPIQLPCLEEQEKVADFLSSIGRKIESVEREIDRNKEFKKGLLQQMFV